jgi:hypothetical protein
MPDNNPLERILREIRRRTRVVDSFPDGQSAFNLAAAMLRHKPAPLGRPNLTKLRQQYLDLAQREGMCPEIFALSIWAERRPTFAVLCRDYTDVVHISPIVAIGTIEAATPLWAGRQRAGAGP